MHLDYSNNHRLPDQGELALEHSKDTLQEVVEHSTQGGPHKPVLVQTQNQ